MHEFTLTVWTPSEAAAITGVATASQLDWRRRGFLPTQDGHARHDAFSLARMITLRLMSESGVPLADAAELAPWCAVGIVYHALQRPEAWDGDWRAAAMRGAHPQMTAEDRIPPLARRVLRRYAPEGAGRVIPARYFIWWADGRECWHESLDEAFTLKPDDPRAAGPVTVLDQASMGYVLLHAADRPLVYVESSDSG